MNCLYGLCQNIKKNFFNKNYSYIDEMNRDSLNNVDDDDDDGNWTLFFEQLFQLNEILNLNFFSIIYKKHGISD